MQHARFRAPLILAILVLLLPVLYVGAYFALVKPMGQNWEDPFYDAGLDYRWGGKTAAAIFWPIEQADRQLRPGYWEPGWTSFPSLPPP